MDHFFADFIVRVDDSVEFRRIFFSPNVSWFLFRFSTPPSTLTFWYLFHIFFKGGVECGREGYGSTYTQGGKRSEILFLFIGNMPVD